MKKILLIFFCSYSFTSFSQDFNKGDKLIGGSLSFSIFNTNTSGQNTYYASNVGILPSYSWFIKNNLAMGIRGSISYYKNITKYATGEKRLSRSLYTGIAVFFKKYKTLKDKFGLYLEHEVGASYINGKEQYPASSPDFTKQKFYGASYKFSPGVFYRFSNRFIGEGNFGGVYASYQNGQGGNSFGGGVSFLQFFNLGINYLLDKKKG